MSITDPGPNEAKEYLSSYQSFASTMRAWLVAYGIGAPVLFATQGAFECVFTNKDAAKPIIYMYLIGVCIQILSALLFKISMWYIFWGAANVEFKTSWRYKISDWLSEQLWVEILLDTLTIGLFAWATARVLIMFVAETNSS
jgi:preprotein translocase subunit SecY